MKRTCCVCKKEPKPESEDPTGETELRPYGPGGAPICYLCATRSSEAMAAAQAECEKHIAQIADRGEAISVTDHGVVGIKVGEA